MNKIRLLLIYTALPLFCAMIFGSPAYGQGGGNTQKRTVSGMVTDENDNPVSGATVIVQGTTTGTTTTAGKFTIQVTPASILEVKFLGYKTAEVKVGTQTNLTIKLETTSETIQDVVVTALGMTRERKSLGYSVGDIKGEAFEKVRELNVINSLAGREPGLIISQTAGGPSGSSHVEIRGSSMLTGNNQPLYVVDGMPIDNTNFGSANKDGGYDLGDGISSITPDDIENISVLKGPAASALYGSQAGNGVIMITTKKASSRKGQSLGVEINSTTTVEQQLTRFDDVQYIYGQGSNGRIYGTIDDRSNSSKSWGPKIDKNLKIWYFDNVLRPYTISNHGIEDFFRLGVTANNSITLNKIYKDAGIRLSYSDLRNRDIVPNSGMNRSTFTVRTNTKIGRKIDVDVKVNYVYEKVNNRPALAGDRNNEGKNLSSLPSTYDLYLLRDNYKDEEGKYYNWNGDVNRVNPYWTINEMSNTSKKNRLISSASISYKITDKLKFKLSGGADITEFSFEDFAPISTPSHESGYLKTQTNSNRTINADAVLTYSTNLGKNMSLVGTAGLNLYRVDNFQTTITGKDMAEPEIKKINSFSDKTIVESPYQRQINSAYAMVNLGYKNFAYLDVTVRADNTSTLINNTYVYPSVSGSFIFSELLPSSVSKILSFGKVRASWAEVGNDTSPYQMSLNYALYPHPVGGVSSGQISNSTVPNRDLKPTRTRSWEVGTELYFLNKRIVLDFTYYSQTSRDQIRHVNTSISTGYSTALLNSGVLTNKGIEIKLNTIPVKTKNWQWDLGFNFARNSNKVHSLGESQMYEVENAEWVGAAGVRVMAVVGEELGTIMGKDYKRNENGDIIVDPTTGIPSVSDNYTALGNAHWKFTGGMYTNVRFKNWNLSAIFDIKVGADLYTSTMRGTYSSGRSKKTLKGRDGWYQSEEGRLAAGLETAAWNPTGGYLVDGVVQVKNDDGTISWAPNTRYCNPESYWNFISNNIPQFFVLDNSYVKIREMTLSYSFPRRMIGKALDGLTLSFVARNPLIIFKNVPNIDPDSNYNNGNGKGIEYGSLPSRRSFGFNINLKF